MENKKCKPIRYVTKRGRLKLHKSELQSAIYDQIKINCQSNFIYVIDKFFLWIGLIYKNSLGKGKGLGFKVQGSRFRVTG